jgi:hypothetical protein
MAGAIFFPPAIPEAASPWSFGRWLQVFSGYRVLAAVRQIAPGARRGFVDVLHLTYREAPHLRHQKMHSLAGLRVIPPWAWALLPIAVPALAVALYRCSTLDQLPLGIPDPDPWLRLTLVRDWLQGGSWYDHEVHRGNAPFGGMVSPWTRPLDIVIALLAKAQFWAASIDAKLLRASFLLPVLWMTLLAGGLLRAMRELRPTAGAYFLTPALLASSPMMWNYFAPGNADHHALLAALWAWALAFTIGKSRPVYLGIVLALMLWISPEALALIAAIYMWLGLKRLLGADGRFLAQVATTTALASAIALMIERPPEQWFVPLYDSISIVQVYVLTLCALLAWWFRFTRRLGAFGLGGIAMLGAVWYVYPLFFHGPLAGAHPYIFSDFLPRISEAQPLWGKPAVDIGGMLLQPALALGICFCWRGDIASPTAAAAFFIAITMLLFLAQVRWFYYLHPPAALVLARWLAALLAPNAPENAGYWPAAWLVRLPERDRALRRIPLYLLILAVPTALLLGAAPEKTEAERIIDACAKDSRKIMQSGTLNTLPPTTFLLSTNLGTELLFFTPHHMIAGNYHRDGAAIKYVWESEDLKSLEALRGYIAERKVGALLVCPSSLTKEVLIDPPSVSPRPEEPGILLRLWRGEVSAPWLQRFSVEIPDVSEHAPAILLVQP